MLLNFRYFSDKGVSGSVEYNKLIGRRHIEEDTISANLRWRF